MPVGLAGWSSFVSCRLQIDAQAKGFAIKRFSLDAQTTRSFGSVTASLLQYLEDVLTLQLHQAVRSRWHRRGFFIALRRSVCFGFDVRQSNLAGRCEDREAVHRIFQFANISGPTHLL